MNNITYEEKALENDVVTVTVAVVGAATSTPTIPTTHKHVVSSTSRSGVGTYVLTLTTKARFPQVIGPVGSPCVVGANGRKAFITAIDPDDGTIAVQAKDSTDAAADLATTDTLYITLRYRNSKVRFGEATG